MPASVRDDVRRRLRKRGYNVDQVVKVFSPGDDGADIAPSGRKALTAWYVTPTLRRRTALIDFSLDDGKREEFVYTNDGWSGD